MFGRLNVAAIRERQTEKREARPERKNDSADAKRPEAAAYSTRHHLSASSEWVVLGALESALGFLILTLWCSGSLSSFGKDPAGTRWYRLLPLSPLRAKYLL